MIFFIKTDLINITKLCILNIFSKGKSSFELILILQFNFDMFMRSNVLSIAFLHSNVMKNRFSVLGKVQKKQVRNTIYFG